MRVLWIAMGGSLQDREENPSLTSRYEKAFTEYAPDVELGMAYAADGKHDDRIVQNGITFLFGFFPIYTFEPLEKIIGK